MLQKKILVSVDEFETRVAIIENSQIAEYMVERIDARRTIGNIYKGKITSIVPGMEAAFVDIGAGKNAFLYVSDIAISNNEFKEMLSEDETVDLALYEDEEMLAYPSTLPNLSIVDLLKPGQEVVVQLVKEPIGTKGCRVTTNITLPGRYLVLMPNFEHLGISRKIEEEAERERLQKLVSRLLPSGMGAIIRTAAVGQDEASFRLEIAFLAQQWQKIQARSEKVSAPHLLHSDISIVSQLARDVFNEDVVEFIIDDQAIFQHTKEYVQAASPELVDRLVFYEGTEALFRTYGVVGEIKSLLNHKVGLKCGGSIVIDEIEALTAIDVNTGRYLGKRNLEETVLNTNLEAATEIARQLRLRDIGGIIIIDFIDMRSPANQELLLRHFEECLKRDRSRTNIIQMNDLGMVEMTRKRVRRSLKRYLTQSCPYCKSQGHILSFDTMIIKVLRRVKEACKENLSDEVTFMVHPKLATAINQEWSEYLDQLSKQYAKKIQVVPKKSFHFEQFEEA